MNESAWLSLAACTGQLALAGFALARVGKSPLALPLSLLSIALSTWNFAHFAFAVSGEEGWRLVALAATLTTAPCAVHFILAFTGQRRRFAKLIYSTYGLFGLFTAVALSALGSPWVAVRATSLTFSRLTHGARHPAAGRRLGPAGAPPAPRSQPGGAHPYRPAAAGPGAPGGRCPART